MTEEEYVGLKSNEFKNYSGMDDEEWDRHLHVLEDRKSRKDSKHFSENTLKEMEDKEVAAYLSREFEKYKKFAQQELNALLNRG